MKEERKVEKEERKDGRKAEMEGWKELKGIQGLRGKVRKKKKVTSDKEEERH